MATTIRSGISDLVNVLNKVRNNVTIPEDQVNLQKLINALFILWQQVIFDQMDKSTQDYKNAIQALNEAETAATDAYKDLGKVGKAIKSAATAAKAVDKIVKFAIKLLV